MKFVALVSGGKDSMYSIMECIQNGHTLVCCAHLAPAPPSSEEEEEESYMYQTAGSECVEVQVRECLGVPFYLETIKGNSKNTELVYQPSFKDDMSSGDEVEDLFRLLKRIVTENHPEVTAVSSGAILSTYQRTRVESVCSRLNLTSLSYLWRMPNSSQRDLMHRMIYGKDDDGDDYGKFDTILVKVASPPGLKPYRHLNQTIQCLFESGHFDRLYEKYQFSICGEGGEYETLVLDCPIFQKKLVLDEVDIVTDPNNDEIGSLRILKCHAEPKQSSTGAPLNIPGIIRSPSLTSTTKFDNSCKENKNKNKNTSSSLIKSTDQIKLSSEHSPSKIKYIVSPPSVKLLPSGLFHVSAMTATTINQNNHDHNDEVEESDMAVAEALAIFKTLKEILSSCIVGSPCTPQDVVMVHLYLSDINYFAKINQHYKEFFGTFLPPSRSCVGIGALSSNKIKEKNRVMLDCLVQRGSGNYMRKNTGSSYGEELYLKECQLYPHSKLRSTLHVQSMSHWAPICVGPYAQSQTLRSCIIWLAGQIGLNPATMTFRETTLINQLKQCWTNAASVLDGHDDNPTLPNNTLSALVYVSSKHIPAFQSNEEESVSSSDWWNEIQDICSDSIRSNGGIDAGVVDDNCHHELYGGYEDEGTYEEMLLIEQKSGTKKVEKNLDKNFFILVVSIPQMPLGALAEVELICTTPNASNCLDTQTFHNQTTVGTNDNCNDENISNKALENGDANNDEGNDLVWDIGFDAYQYDEEGNRISPNDRSSLKEKESTLSRLEQNLMETAVMNQQSKTPLFKLDSIVRSIGEGCVAIANVAATPILPELEDSVEALHEYSLSLHDLKITMYEMVSTAMKLVQSVAHFDNPKNVFMHTLNLRIYYLSKTATTTNNKRKNLIYLEEVNIRNALQSVLLSSSFTGQQNNIPTFTLVPVQDMKLFSSDKENREMICPILTMDFMVLDLIHTETEMWVHQARSY